jgi:hypothetical protein
LTVPAGVPHAAKRHAPQPAARPKRSEGIAPKMMASRWIELVEMLTVLVFFAPAEYSLGL